MPNRTVSVRDGQALFDLVSYGRRGPGPIDQLSPAQVAQVARTVRRAPEVMVKISGGGRSPGGVAAHFRYVGRRDFEIESDEGEHFTGRNAAKKLVEEWDLKVDAAEAQSAYSGKPGRKAAKLVHNVVLSMPAGTCPERLFAASRDFARETFALEHRYALVLHTNEPHPHVHLVVRAMSEQGERLNIRKATLRQWRREFARHLRAHGVEANATERVVRGVTTPRKRDAIYRADQEERSTHMEQCREYVAADLLKGGRGIEPGKEKLIRTRQDVERGWRAVNDILIRQGQPELAANIIQFMDAMPHPRTDNEQIAAEMLERARQARVKERPNTR